jgi:hypothetical protein
METGDEIEAAGTTEGIHPRQAVDSLCPGHAEAFKEQAKLLVLK